jgi:hypothetical protein
MIGITDGHAGIRDKTVKAVSVSVSESSMQTAKTYHRI